MGWGGGGDGLRDGGVSGFDCHILKYFKLTSIQVGAAVGCVVPCTETRNTDRQAASRTDGRTAGRSEVHVLVGQLTPQEEAHGRSRRRENAERLLSCCWVFLARSWPSSGGLA